MTFIDAAADSVKQSNGVLNHVHDHGWTFGYKTIMHGALMDFTMSQQPMRPKTERTIDSRPVRER